MSAAYMDFQNPEVIITGPDDPRLHFNDLTASCFHQQAADGPTYITVRATATDAVLERIASRFGVDLVELQLMREKQAG